MKIPDLRVGATVVAIAGLCAGAQGEARAAVTCSARSTVTRAPVVELYTSEGCSSCPPADRWLSGLKRDPSLVALAFHVDYWDRLGWRDRFASARYTERQEQQQASNGARFSYTPQVVVDGVDRKDWAGIRLPIDAERAASPLELTLQRNGNHVVATVRAGRGAPSRVAAYWTVTEQGYVTDVKAGENDGATLKHDAVVRAYRPVAPWPESAGTARTLEYDLAGAADPAHSRSVNLVVVDAGTGRPVQALKLGC